MSFKEFLNESNEDKKLLKIANKILNYGAKKVSDIEYAVNTSKVQIITLDEPSKQYKKTDNIGGLTFDEFVALLKSSSAKKASKFSTYREDGSY